MLATNVRGKLSRAGMSGLIFSWCVTALLATPVAAQRYSSVKPRISEREFKTLRRTVTAALRDQAQFDAAQEDIQKYFVQGYFPMMTSTNPEGLGELAKMRENLFKQYIGPAGTPQIQQTLTGWALRIMPKIAAGNFHPAVRYNAVLTLGSLDQRYSKLVGLNPDPPVPLPAATEALLGLLERDEIDGTPIPSSVKIGAMQGLTRHARFGIDPKYADRLTKAAVAVIEQEQRPTDISDDVHHWMKCQAADILVQQFAKNPNSQVQNALTALVGDSAMGLDDRCFAANLLANLNYEGAAGIEGDPTVQALGNLAVDVLDAEEETADEFAQEMLEGVPGRQLRGRAPRIGRQRETGPVYERRRILTRIKSIRTGVGTFKKAVENEKEEQLTALNSSLKEVFDIVADKDSGNLDVTDAVIDGAQNVRALVSSWNPSDEPDEEPAEDAFSQR